VHALAPGNIQVTASLGDVQTQAAVKVVAAVNALRIVPAEPTVAASGSVQLSVVATSSDGQNVAVDPQAVRWNSQGNGGRVVSGGLFSAGPRPARTVVSASVGGVTNSVTVLSGDHAVMFSSVPHPGASPGSYHYAASPAELPGGVDDMAAPDGAASLRLAYDFSTSQATRAAYAQTDTPLPGKPTALSIDVFGDGNGAWLRGGYRNADGNNESLTIARHVDWRGWKTLRADIPDQSAWPITWTRFYVIERAKGAREQGSIWFRNFSLIYPGP
jgi:hypothetical protein